MFTKIDYKDLAEILGFVLGDGNIAKTGYKLTIGGNTQDELYYKSRVIPLIAKYFTVNPKIYKLKEREGINLEFHSKELINFLLKWDMKRGKKINPKIPRIVLNNKLLYSSFLRGLFDTDGTLKFSRQNKNINYYPRIGISQKPCRMVYELKKLISASNFNSSFWEEDNSRGYLKENSIISNYQISGKNNLKLWFKIIKPKNPIHITKYLIWKKLGYCPKNTTVYQRLKLLNDTKFYKKLNYSISKSQ